jgi:DNA-directed RNA polymerase I and III subunit RPAC1
MPNGLQSVMIYFVGALTFIACASYRLLPSITITAPITGADAQKFVECFPKSVIEIEKSKGVETAIVRNPRKDTVSRECLRHPEFSDKVILSRIHDHFICILVFIH